MSKDNLDKLWLRFCSCPLPLENGRLFNNSLPLKSDGFEALELTQSLVGRQDIIKFFLKNQQNTEDAKKKGKP
tara:strand:+ start:346 stop:564 length:219 start_codon:yes stop_codon:yes gene_type:complete